MSPRNAAGDRDGDAWDDPSDGWQGLDDLEAPQPDDVRRFAHVGVRCPACNAELYDDAAVCSQCGELIERGPGRLPRWVVITSVVLLVLIGTGLLRLVL